MSSGTTHKMRQPGRLLAPYDPGNCQVCDPNKGIPNSTLGLVLEGMPFGCCSIDISSTQANPHVLTAITDPCLKDSFGNKLACTWTLTLTLGGLYVEFTVTLSCVGGTTPTIAIGVNQVDSSGAFIAAVASGSATLSGACGAVDCSQLNGLSGTLTLYDGSICQPSAGHCTSPTWAVLFGTQNCPANHANECCCGGPTGDCFYLCINDQSCGGQMEVVVCKKGGSFSGDNGAMTGSLSYDASAGFTISWNCGGTNHSITIPPGSPGWTLSGGHISLSGSGPGFTVQGGDRPQCGHTSSSCGPCAPNTFPSMIFAELSGGGLTNNQCLRCTDISSVWALEDLQFSSSPVSGNCATNSGCGHYFYDPHFQPNAGNCINTDQSACGDWILGMGADVCIIDVELHWKWIFGWQLNVTGNSNNTNACANCEPVGATYSGPIMNNGDSCDLSTPVELTLDAPWGASNAFWACFGPPPDKVLLFT